MSKDLTISKSTITFKMKLQGVNNICNALKMLLVPLKHFKSNSPISLCIVSSKVLPIMLLLSYFFFFTKLPALPLYHLENFLSPLKSLI